MNEKQRERILYCIMNDFDQLLETERHIKNKIVEAKRKQVEFNDKINDINTTLQGFSEDEIRNYCTESYIKNVLDDIFILLNKYKK